MARIRNYDGLETLLGPVGTGASAARHKAFCWFASPMVWDASTFLCWQCVQQFKAAPSKRKALFIYDRFMTTSKESGTVTATLDVLGVVNLGGSGDVGGGINPAKAVSDDIANIRKVKTWWGKMNNASLVERYKSPSPQFFSVLERILKLSITDLLKGDPGYNSDSTYRYDAKYTASIAAARVALSGASFDPDAAGLWGG
ncbi:hypothetical protein JHL17_27220 [Azospirillum sp. YIM B02556]|uniref:Uncharacterized protein n=1 Tax=Azospirillum endophyticum TaxID=2800326 RepID=A0ABS1FCZ4_9PROT|nr:hypothetical protein [Azospirillum endophyticum]MBK1841097.1 hypothetical protein [Azospirillum endophyticum]